MSQYVSHGAAVIDLDAASRSRFINRTYMHLTGAIFALVGFEVIMFKAGLAQAAVGMIGQNWIAMIILLLAVSFGARWVAYRAESKVAQYMALGSYVVMMGLILLPILYIANQAMPEAIGNAAAITFVGFGILTAIVFVTGKDFSFLRGIVYWGFALAALACIGALIFGFTLGPLYSLIVIGLCGASILYDTSNVLHHSPEDRYVAAALELFCSITIMFFHILRLFLMRGED
ncbi:MAG: permease [Verrucomicrobiales bacterium]|nr:permease [Verrucomicrobiales bacterium]|tara:strand:+ start:1657 stop:2352 length:696 start_codon:yes stop_codon:yes gene_type:complete